MSNNLSPIFTNDGLAAIEAAHGRGVALEITHIALGDGEASGSTRTGIAIRDDNDVPLAAARARTALFSEHVRSTLTAGAAAGEHQVMMEGEVPAGDPEFFIREIGFFAGDTLVAYWSDPDTSLGYRSQLTPWSFRFVLAWSDLPVRAITVAFTNRELSGVLERVESHIADDSAHRPIATAAEAQALINNTRVMTPLRTKEAIEGNRLPIASQSQAETGTENEKRMTPLRTKQAIDAQRPIATQGEAETGTDNTKVMTPLRTKEAIEGNRSPIATQDEAEAGIDNTNRMTPLRTKEAIDAQRPIATQGEAETGTSNTKVMTPLRTKQAVDAQRPIATQGEAETGTDNTKVMTPLRTKEAIEGNRLPIATQAEAEAGTDNSKRMTSLRVREAVDARAFDHIHTMREKRRVFAISGLLQWHVPATVTHITVHVWGGGGGGGNHDGFGLGAGASGSAGGYARKAIDVTPGQVIPITIGAGGAGGIPGINRIAQRGQPGGTSSFGSFCSATGGLGGYGESDHGYTRRGGYGTGGDVNLRGQPGNPPHYSTAPRGGYQTIPVTDEGNYGSGGQGGGRPENSARGYRSNPGWDGAVVITWRVLGTTP